MTNNDVVSFIRNSGLTFIGLRVCNEQYKRNQIMHKSRKWDFDAADFSPEYNCGTCATYIGGARDMDDEEIMDAIESAKGNNNYVGKYAYIVGGEEIVDDYDGYDYEVVLRNWDNSYGWWRGCKVICRIEI